jgi:hypothetical protein
LAEAQQTEGKPGQNLARAKAVLGYSAEANPHLDRSGFNHIAVPQDRLRRALAVDGRESLGAGLKNDSAPGFEVKREMNIPDAIVFEGKIGISRSSDPKREMAGLASMARHASVENLNLDH